MAYGHESTTVIPGRTDKAFRDARARLKALPGSDICWQCGQKIDMTLPWNDPMEWTADHVQSIASGGDPYALSNLKPAHRSCNSKRGRAMREGKFSRNW